MANNDIVNRLSGKSFCTT